MRASSLLILIAACAPGPSPQSPAPSAPALRSLGPDRAGGTLRLVAALPAPSYVMVVGVLGTDRPMPLALSIATDRQLAAGEHVLIAQQAPGGGRGPSQCTNPEIRMQAIFPTPGGTQPITSLGEPPQSPAAGPVPVLVHGPAGEGCPARQASPAVTLHLLLLPEPAPSGAVRAALANLPPESRGNQAVHLLARALGATAVVPASPHR